MARMKVKYIVMPFYQIETPSFGLTILKDMIHNSFGDSIELEICYLNHDFANYIGINIFEKISFSQEVFATGIGEWLFNELAFPTFSHDENAYFKRYFPGDKYSKFIEYMKNKKNALEAFLCEMIQKYNLLSADIVGFTSMFSQNLACFGMANLLKRLKPELIIIMGGANCEFPMAPEIIRHVPSIDFVFSGPSMVSMQKYLENILQKRYSDCHTIQGVFSAENIDKYQDHPAMLRGKIHDINIQNNIDYDDYLQSLEYCFQSKTIKPILFFQTSVGCWWGERSQCSFCGLNGVDTSFRCMDSAIAQTMITELIEKYKNQCDRFMCVDNIIPQNYVEDVIHKIPEYEGIHIFYEVRSTLTYEQLKIMSVAGIKQVGPGIESLSTHSLKLMRKGLTVFQNLEFLKNCILADVFPMWNLLIGLPDESEETYKRFTYIFRSLYHLVPPRYLSQIVYMPYSIYFEQKEKYGLEIVPYDYYKYIYPFDNKSIEKMSYFFRNKKISDSYLIMLEYYPVIQDELAQWQSRWAKGVDCKPMLYFTDNGDSVYDSRGEHALYMRLSKAEKEVLKMCASSIKLDNIVIEEAENVASVLSTLEAKGLIFEENGFYYNLIFDEKPNPLTYSIEDYFASTMDNASWEKEFLTVELNEYGG